MDGGFELQTELLQDVVHFEIHCQYQAISIDVHKGLWVSAIFGF